MNQAKNPSFSRDSPYQPENTVSLEITRFFRTFFHAIVHKSYKDNKAELQYTCVKHIITGFRTFVHLFPPLHLRTKKMKKSTGIYGPVMELGEFRTKCTKSSYGIFRVERREFSLFIIVRIRYEHRTIYVREIKMVCFQILLHL